MLLFPVFVHGYQRYPGKDYPKFDIADYTNSNRQECGDLCNKIINCVGFEFNKVRRKCWLKRKALTYGKNFKSSRDGELFIMKSKLEA